LLIRRKNIRLPEYDYSSAGAYFVTICTDQKQRILSELPTVGADDSVRPCELSDKNASITELEKIVGADDSVRPKINVYLTAIGEVVDACIRHISEYNVGVSVDKYVIMPNHVHILLRLGGQSRPPLQKIVQAFKSVSTRKCWKLGVSKLWQRSFYDHVIRDESDYLRIWQYIDENPIRWSEDIFFDTTHCHQPNETEEAQQSR